MARSTPGRHVLEVSRVGRALRNAGQPIDVAHDQGSTYASMVALELQAQRDRRSATLDRLARIQTSAALPVTLVAAAASVSRGSSPAWSTRLLAAASVMLVLSVLVATWGSTRSRSKVADPDKLEKFVTDGWQDEERDARLNVVHYQVDQIIDLSAISKCLYGWATAASIVQSLGLVFALTGGAVLLFSK